MDFEAHTISDNDFNGIKKLLQQVQQREAIIQSSHNCTRAESDVTRTPHPIFFLWKQVFLKAHVNTSEMAEIIIQQNHVGSVIKVSSSCIELCCEKQGVY